MANNRTNICLIFSCQGIYPASMEKHSTTGENHSPFCWGCGGFYGFLIHRKRLEWENRQALQTGFCVRLAHLLEMQVLRSPEQRSVLLLVCLLQLRLVSSTTDQQSVLRSQMTKNLKMSSFLSCRDEEEWSSGSKMTWKRFLWRFLPLQGEFAPANKNWSQGQIVQWCFGRVSFRNPDRDSRGI